jgi:hypothetical protein
MVGVNPNDQHPKGYFSNIFYSFTYKNMNIFTAFHSLVDKRISRSFGSWSLGYKGI